jgi:hypothetical protein
MEVESQVDWILQLLVWVTGQSTIEWPITLQLSGMHVSGFITSRERYFKGLRDTIRQRARYGVPEGLTEEDLSSGVQSIFDTLSDTSEGASIEQRQNTEDEEAWREIAFIHLRDARFLSPDGRLLSTDQATWWRGRLDRVHGFYFGAFGPPPR